jgi:hypothetical protein
MASPGGRPVRITVRDRVQPTERAAADRHGPRSRQDNRNLSAAILVAAPVAHTMIAQPLVTAILRLPELSTFTPLGVAVLAPIRRLACVNRHAGRPDAHLSIDRRCHGEGGGPNGHAGNQNGTHEKHPYKLFHVANAGRDGKFRETIKNFGSPGRRISRRAFYTNGPWR